MIAPVNLHVAIQTCPVEPSVVQCNINGLTPLAWAPCLQLARVSHIGMAPLAKVWHLCFQKTGAGRAVGRMAGKTLFNSRRVLPQVRASYICMAFETFEVGVLCAYESIRDGPVGVVAIRTLHFPLPYGMVRLSQEFGFYPLMTLGAHLGLSRL